MLRPIQGAGLTGASGREGVSSRLARPAFNCWKLGLMLKYEKIRKQDENSQKSR